LACTDPNCVDCKYNIFYCLLCAVTYTPDLLGNCKSCAINCDFCDISGPNKCDSNNCSLGYSLLNNLVCMKCLNGCASCLSTYPFTCLQCLDGSYLSDNNLTCISCP